MGAHNVSILVLLLPFAHGLSDPGRSPALDSAASELPDGWGLTSGFQILSVTGKIVTQRSPPTNLVDAVTRDGELDMYQVRSALAQPQNRTQTAWLWRSLRTPPSKVNMQRHAAFQ